MNDIARYLDAAERENTRRSYDSAIRHFETEWKGLLPATANTVAQYLADYAGILAINTLRQRLAALSRWHSDHGFSDPTKSPRVRQVLKGIRATHAVAEQRARPLELDVLQQVAQWLDLAISHAKSSGDQLAMLRHMRNRSLVLLGFWRGFRSDELARLRVENILITPGKGMSCFLERSKGDRQMEGRDFPCPALSRLCPVAAFEAWIDVAKLSNGPVFRKIDRWGHISDDSLRANSLVVLLRELLKSSGIPSSDEYSSHSLRRGFAGWARSSGWDLKDLMEYVGWKDIKSAMRYLESDNASLQERFERGLGASPAQKSFTPSVTPPVMQREQSGAIPTAIVQVTMSLERFTKESRGLTRGRRLIEEVCLGRYAIQRLDTRGTRYELSIPYSTRDALDEAIYALLDEMYRIADDNQCLLEVSLHEPTSGNYWD